MQPLGVYGKTKAGAWLNPRTGPLNTKSKLNNPAHAAGSMGPVGKNFCLSLPAPAPAERRNGRTLREWWPIRWVSLPAPSPWPAPAGLPRKAGGWSAPLGGDAGCSQLVRLRHRHRRTRVSAGLLHKIAAQGQAAHNGRLTRQPAERPSYTCSIAQ